MAHLTTPAINTADKYSRWEFYLNVLMRVEPVYESLRQSYQILDAQWEGIFEIPPQNAKAIYGKDASDSGEAFDNATRQKLNPSTWINAMMGGINTSDLPIKRKTITVPESGYTGGLSTAAILEDNLLKFAIPAAKGTVTAAAGDLFALGTPKRVYEISYIDASGNWFCAPGILPQGTTGDAGTIGLPQAVSKIKFRLRGTPQVVESQDRNLYGGWSVPWQEAIE